MKGEHALSSCPSGLLHCYLLGSAAIANHVPGNSPSPPSGMQVLALPAGAAALAESDTARYEIWGWGGNVLAVQVRAAWWRACPSH